MKGFLSSGNQKDHRVHRQLCYSGMAIGLLLQNSSGNAPGTTSLSARLDFEYYGLLLPSFSERMDPFTIATLLVGSFMTTTATLHRSKARLVRGFLRLSAYFFAFSLAFSYLTFRFAAPSRVLTFFLATCNIEYTVIIEYIFISKSRVI